MPEKFLDHDTWNYETPKSAKMTAIELDPIFGVFAYDGKRNPGFRSATSHTVWLTYRTPAHDLLPQVGICESAAEAAVAYDVLRSPETYDVKFQPLTVHFDFDGKPREYTHDLLVTFRNGYRRLIFVRNGTSLTKPKTWREIEEICKATPRTAANDMIVVDADHYTRQRWDNLFRMHELFQQPDDEADEMVLHAALNLKTLWQMHDLFPRVSLSQDRVFRACYRLIGRKKLLTNLDHVILETSRVWLPS